MADRVPDTRGSLSRRMISAALAAAVAAAVTVLATHAALRTQASPDSTRIVAAAEAFLATLDAAKRTKANPELNAKTRTVWSNLPSGITMQVGATERNGLKLGEMTPAQEKAALALLASALSRDGYQKVMQIVDADEVLEQQAAPKRPPTQRIRFGRAEYYLAVLGQPSAAGTWMLQFGGHHLAVNVTLAGRSSVLTPTHTGTQPGSYTIEGRSIRPLGDEYDKALALMNSLSADQQKEASLGVAVRNLVLGPGEDGKMIAPEGVKVAAFSAAQKAALIDLAAEWVAIVGDAAAATKMAEIKTTINDTHFAWAGPTTAAGAYFRIQGPAVFIEFAPQGNPPSLEHVHPIYRDPAGDYAAKAVAR
jgi:hypothetical protein